MENRIQINGVWYVREDEETNVHEVYPEDIKESVTQNIVWLEGVVYEDDDYCWEASRIYRDFVKREFHSDIDIKFTDKRIKPWKEELWDHNGWMFGVYSNNPESMVEVNKAMDKLGVKRFQSFLEILVEKGWLKKP